MKQYAYWLEPRQQSSQIVIGFPGQPAQDRPVADATHAPPSFSTPYSSCPLKDVDGAEWSANFPPMPTCLPTARPTALMMVLLTTEHRQRRGKLLGAGRSARYVSAPTCFLSWKLADWLNGWPLAEWQQIARQAGS